MNSTNCRLVTLFNIEGLYSQIIATVIGDLAEGNTFSVNARDLAVFEDNAWRITRPFSTWPQQLRNMVVGKCMALASKRVTLRGHKRGDRREGDIRTRIHRMLGRAYDVAESARAEQETALRFLQKAV